MPPVIDTQHRTSDLDRDLETARRGFSALEREEAELSARQEEEHQRWIERKATKFRPPLELFLKVFPLIRELDDDWRGQVFRGRVAFDPKTEGSIRTLYAVWLGYSQMFVEKAEYLGRHGSNFDAELDRLGRYRREADKLLRAWEPPVPSLAPSFRSPPLSAETTARLRELFPDGV
jgi:hypothetical protein